MKRRFVLAGEVDDEQFSPWLDALYEPDGDPKPDGCEEATFADFAEMVRDAALSEFGHTPLKFELTIEAAT